MAVGSARAAAGWSTAVARPLTVAATGTTMMVTRAERGAEGLAEMAVVAVATATDATTAPQMQPAVVTPTALSPTSPTNITSANGFVPPCRDDGR